MALLGNGSLLFKSPGRFLGGAGAAGDRMAFGDAFGSAVVARFSGLPATASIPSGYAMDGWAPPRTAGAIKAVGTLDATTSMTADIAGGRNGVASATATTDLVAIGQLVAGLAAVIALGCELSATVAGAAAGAVTASSSTEMTAEASAVAHMTAAAALSVEMSAEPTGIGHMAATISSYTELSVEGLRDAIWNSVAASYSSPGTMGELLNAAGSGGLASEFQTILRELYRLAGLDPTKPLVVTTTTRTAGDIEQAISEASGTVTVTRVDP